MASISPLSEYAPVDGARVVAATTRDPRLDFYRGIAMFIILIAHIPNNTWTNWIPARFGYSDATEIFVFCSGMASAIAFGGSFASKGWWIGTARVAYRVWQVYWAHICLFFFVLMTMAALDTYGNFDKLYINSLNLQHFTKDPMTQLVGIFTLTYVPNYFDILPMYLVVLAMMPLFMALSGLNLWLAGAASVTIWLAANVGGLALPAEPWSDREWFFNPFGWQLLFFTGFGFMRGWIPAPPTSRGLMWICIAFLLLSAPFGSWKVFQWLNAANGDIGNIARQVWEMDRIFSDQTGFSLRDKSDFGILRYAHFLALAYLAWMVAGKDGVRLKATGTGTGAQIWTVVLKIVTKVGQQSLAVFVFSMALARLIGFALDQIGRSAASVAALNLLGIAMIIGVAFLVGWFKTQPWRSKRT